MEGRCVVRGAPKRICIAKRRGVERAVRRRDIVRVWVNGC